MSELGVLFTDVGSIFKFYIDIDDGQRFEYSLIKEYKAILKNWNIIELEMNE